ncbi:MAG TPA: ATP-binding protein, partial [Gammaproteobacteria bacterium]|nr:ATP-binding protein [Gammaproteobacteria bacterium]
MNTLFEQLIADFHERNLPELTQRAVDLPALAGKIDAIIGMRRTGKTWFLFQVMKQYLEQGIAKESMLYINFDDERLFPLTAQELGGISEAYYRLYPQNRGQRCYFFFDEIQNVSGWENYLRRLVDTENVQIAVTGSSARLLSHEIATSLRGRSISTEMFPFSFKEVLQHE